MFIHSHGFPSNCIILFAKSERDATKLQIYGNRLGDIVIGVKGFLPQRAFVENNIHSLHGDGAPGLPIILNLDDDISALYKSACP